ncbi:MAG TPA: hypothetical protein VF881_16925 [Polyangiaceae bacterium]
MSDAAGVSCGDRTCALDEYCLGTSGPPPLPGADPYQYACQLRPARCGSPSTCSCIVPYGDDAGSVSRTNNICTDQVSPDYAFAGCVDDGAGTRPRQVRRTLSSRLCQRLSPQNVPLSRGGWHESRQVSGNPRGHATCQGLPPCDSVSLFGRWLV